jgi:hypothetical protein
MFIEFDSANHAPAVIAIVGTSDLAAEDIVVATLIDGH